MVLLACSFSMYEWCQTNVLHFYFVETEVKTLKPFNKYRQSTLIRLMNKVYRVTPYNVWEKTSRTRAVKTNELRGFFTKSSTMLIVAVTLTVACWEELNCVGMSVYSKWMTILWSPACTVLSSKGTPAHLVCRAFWSAPEGVLSSVSHFGVPLCH